MSEHGSSDLSKTGYGGPGMAGNVRVGRAALLGTTALVGLAYASPAAAQIVAAPAGGGTITAPGTPLGSLKDESGTGRGVLIRPATSGDTIAVTGVNLNQSSPNSGASSSILNVDASGTDSEGATTTIDLAGSNSFTGSLSNSSAILLLTNNGNARVRSLPGSSLSILNEHGVTALVTEGTGSAIVDLTSATIRNRVSGTGIGITAAAGGSTGLATVNFSGSILANAGSGFQYGIYGSASEGTGSSITLANGSTVVASTAIRTLGGGFTVTTGSNSFINGTAGSGIDLGSAFDTVTVGTGTTVQGATYGIYGTNGGTVTNSGTVTSSSFGVSLFGGSLTNLLGGVVSATGAAVVFNPGGGGAALTNGGTISADNLAVSSNTQLTAENTGLIRSTSSGAIQTTSSAPLELGNSGDIVGATHGVSTSSSAQIVNSGRIASGTLAAGLGSALTPSAAAGSFGIRLGAGGSVNNEATGSILGGERGILVSAGNANVTNHGLIRGTVDGIRADGLLELLNEGTIQTSGGAGSAAGVYMNAAGTHFVRNRGTITGGADATFGYGVSIDAGNLILNNDSGVISGGAGALRLSSTGQQIVNINAGSTVSGKILADDSGSRSIRISGALTGAYDASAGSGVDELTLASTGSVGGAVNLGAGNDSFTWEGGTIGAAVDGGTGTDAFVSELGLGNSGSLNLSNLSGFESQAHQSGTLTLTGSQTFAGSGSRAWLLGAGTTTDLSGSFTAANTNSAFELSASAPTTFSILSGGTLTGFTAIFANGPATATINNQGTINAALNGIFGGSGAINLTNSGSITATNSSGVSFAFGSSTLLNSGTITGGSGSNGYGVLSQFGALTLTNRAGGTIGGNIGVLGGFVSGGSSAGGLLTIANQAGAVINGLTAIQVQGIAGLTLTNAGSVNGTSNAIYSTSSGAINVINAAGGTIVGGNAGAALAMVVGGGTFTNYGAASSGGGNGVLATGNAGVTINLHAGSSTGSIVGGDGNDTLAIYNGRGTAGTATVDNISGITLQNAGTLAGASFGSISLGGGSNNLRLRGTGDGTAANGAAGTIALGSVSNVAILTKFDSGTWTLTGTPANPFMSITGGNGSPAGTLLFDLSGYQGVVTVNGSTIRAIRAGGFGTGTIYTLDPTIQYGATGEYSNNIVLASTNPANDPTRIQVDSGVTATLTGTITESGGAQPLVFDGPGTTILTNVQSYTGGTTIAGGTLIERNQTLASGQVSVAAGARLEYNLTAGGDNFGRYFQGGVTLTGSGVVAITGSRNLSWRSNMQLSSAAELRVESGSFTASSDLAGVWTNNLSDLFVASGASFFTSEAQARVDALTGAGTVQLGDGSLTVGVANGSGAFSGTIANQGGVAGRLLKEGTGTQTLSGVNTYTGGTTINGGTLAVQGGSALSDVGAVSVGSAGTFAVSSGETIGTLTGSGATTVAANQNLTLANASGTYTGTITGGALTQTAGSWTFGGTRSGGGASAINLIGGALNVAATGSVQGGQFLGVRVSNPATINNLGSIINTGTGGDSTVGAAIGVFATSGNTVITNGSASNSSALISGRNAAINHVTGATGTLAITNHARIYGDLYNAIENQNPSGALTVTNLASGVIHGAGNAGGGNGIVQSGTTLLTVNNAGTIVGRSSGISSQGAVAITNSGLIGSGTLSSQAAGTYTVSGIYGIDARGGTVTNNAGGTISGFANGIRNDGAALTLTNGGTITSSQAATSNSFGAAVLSNVGATIVNQSGGLIQSMGSGTRGIEIVGGGSVDNAGSIFGNGGTAVLLGIGGTVTNRAGGSIAGSRGVGIQGASGTVDNAGSIEGLSAGNNGVFMNFGASTLINRATGSIRGSRGVNLAGSSATVDNAGSILGTQAANIGLFTSGALTLTNQTGGSITGAFAVGALNGGTIVNSGAITGTSAGVDTTGASNASLNITNSGRIESTGSSGRGIFLVAKGELTNEAGGTITSVMTGVRMESGGQVTNAGTISGTGTAGFNNNYSGLWLRLAPDYLVDNSGLVSGGFAGIIMGGSGGRINNSGTVSSLVPGGNGIYVTGPAGSVLVANTGTISTSTAGNGSYGIGSDATSGTLIVVNGGSITADAGIFSTASGTIQVTNGAGGTISGTIYSVRTNGSAGLNLANYGTLSGPVGAIGAGGANVTLHAGSTAGNVTFGSAADTVTLYNGRGTGAAGTVDATTGITLQNAGTLAAASVGLIDFGEGSNTLNLGGDGDGSAGNGAGGSLSLDSVSNLTTLIKRDTGTWTLTGAAASPAMTINAGTGSPGGLLVFDGTTGLAGAINVNGAIIRAVTAGAFGTGTITTIDPTIQYGATGTYANNIILSSTDPVNDPARIQVDAGVTATLTGMITENSTSQPLVFDGLGTTILTNTQSYTGGTTIASGTLLVNGSIGSETSVGNGARLGGSGTISRPVTIADGGRLVGGLDTTLTMGSLSLSSGSIIDALFGSTSSPVQFAVTGNLVLDGTLNVSSPDYGFGVYRLFTYGGTLTDNGLAIGTTPPGTGLTEVQTSVAGQVNFVNAPPELLFWDGTGPASNGQVNGGSGTWSTGGNNWTNSSGTFNGPMMPQPGFAIFQAPGGTVTVDNSGGQVSVTGIQFAADGYTVTGDSIALTEVSTPIRVGDGTLSGAAFTAVIASSLTGTGGLTKTDLGTLILTGPNYYAGATTVEDGVLAIQNGQAIADTSAVTVNAGGTLRLLSGEAVGTLAGTGNVELGANTLTLTGPSSSFGGVASGTGGITVTGGSLTLSGANTYTGTTLIDGGSFTFGGSNVLADASSLTVQNGTADLGANEDTIGALALTNSTLNGTGTLTATTYTLAGAVVNSSLGAGSLTQASGTSTLNGTSGAGTVNVNGGTLQLGASNRLANTATVTVASGTTLDLQSFNDVVRTLALNGTLAGSGTLTANRYDLASATVNANLGAGTLSQLGGTSVLSGTSAAANVNVNAGTLQLGASNRLTDNAVVSVASGATLDLQTFNDTVRTLSLAGTLNGSGTATATQYGLNGAVVNANLGAGTLFQLNFTSTLNGTAAATNVNVNGGTLQLGASNRLADNAAVAVASGASLNLASFSDTVGSLTLSGTLNGTGTLTAATYGLSGGTVNANLGAGTLNQLSGTSTLNGTSGAATVNVNGGTLLLGGNDRLADSAALTIASGAILDIASFNDTVGSLALSGTLNGTGTLTAATYGLSGATVNGNLGAGTLNQLSGTSTLNGTSGAATVNVNGGTLLLGGNNRVADGAALTVASGAILDIASFNDTVGSLALSGTLNGTGTLTAATYGLSGGTVNGNLGAGTLNQLSGTSTLNGTSGAGAVNVNGGTLLLGGNDRLADTAAVTIVSGAILDIASFIDTVGSLALSGTLNGTGTLTAATFGLSGGTVNGNLGAGTLNQLSGTSTLNGTSGAGAVNVNGGTLLLGASNRLADNAAVVVLDQATLDLAGFEETVGSLALAGTLDGTGTLTAASYALTGAIVNANLGTGTLTQVGDTSTLNGTSGAATVAVNGGTLQLGASDRLADNAELTIASGAVLDLQTFSDTIASLALSGTLDGTGTLTAATYALSGGALNANLGTGTLDQLGGTSALNGTSGAGTVNVNGGTLLLGGNDRLADSAALTIASGAILDIASFSETVGSLALSGTLNGTGTLTAATYGLSGGTVNANLGTGTLNQLSGTSMLNGTSAASLVNVNGGTLLLGASNRLADNAAVVVLEEATLDLAGFEETVGSLALAGTLDGTGTLTAAGYALTGATVNANLGAGTLSQVAGTSTLNGTAAAARVDVDAGTLRLGASQRLADSAIVVVDDQATLDLAGFEETVGLLSLSGTLAGTGTLSAAQYQFTGATMNANLGAGALFQLGGASVLNGTAGAGLVNINAGTLRLGASNRLADTANVVVASGATLDIQNFNDSVGRLGLSGTLAGAGTLTATQYVLSGATVNANLGGGELYQLSGTSTLNGTAGAAFVVAQAGTLRLGASNRLADSATLLIGSGATVDLQNFSDTVGALAIAGSLDGTGTLTAANYQLDGGTVNANLGTGILRQLGGTSLVNGTAGAGLESIEQGVLRLGAANRLADNAEVLVLGNAALDLQGFNDTVGLLRLEGKLDGTGTLTASQYQLNGGVVNANLGAGTLFQLGGTSILNGTAGASTVALTGGTLRLGANERLADAATLVIGSGATLDLNGKTETVGTFFGDTAGAGTLALNGGRLIAGGTNADFGFGGAITGAGNLDKVGTGRLTLAGNFTTTGGINVLSGGLLFSGTTAGSLAVRGGTLNGSGVVGQSLTLASGTLAPSGFGTGISAAIGGFQAASFTGTGGTFAVDFGGSNTGFASDFLRFTGAASLSGSALSVNSISPTSDFTFMQRYLVLQAGTLSGTFANGANFTDLASDPNLKWQLRYDVLANSVVLDVQRNIDFSAGVSGGSANVVAVGTALNGAAGLASDAWAMTLNALAAIPSGQRGATYESIAGQPIPSMTTSVMFNADQFASVLRQRSTVGAGIRGGASVGPMAMNVSGSSSFEMRQLAAVTAGAAIASDTGPGLASDSREDRGGLWLQGYGGRQQLDGDSGFADVDSTNYGVAGGAELRRGSLVAGVAGGYSSIENDVDAFRARSDGDIYNAAVYVGYDDGRTYASAQGGYFSGQLDISREITIGGNPAITAQGEAEFEGYSLGAMIGRRFDLGSRTRLALQAGALHTQVKRDGFTESGAGGLSLSVAEETRDLLTISGDARLSHAVRVGRTAVEPYLQLGVRFNSGDLESVSNVRFTGAPTGLGNFTIQGAALDEVTGVLGGGFEIRANDRLRIGFDVLSTLGENTRESQIGASLRLAF